MSELIRSTMGRQAQEVVKDLDRFIDARLKRPEDMHRPIKVSFKQIKILHPYIKGNDTLVYRGFRIEV